MIARNLITYTVIPCTEEVRTSRFCGIDSGCSMKRKGGHGLCRRNLEDGIGSREGMQESVFDCLENDVRRDSPHADVGGWRGAPLEADAKWSEGSLVSSP